MPIDEYDRRLEILTAQTGRISVFARGARRPSSSLLACTRVFAFGSFDVFRGKNSYSLSGAEISDYFTELSEDIETSAYGFYFLELARYFTRENIEAKDILNLIYVSLRALERKQPENKLIRAIYEIKMLQLNGLCPSADRLEKAEGRFAFAKGLDKSVLYAFEYVTQSGIERLYTFRLSDDVLSGFTSLSGHLMEMFADREFKSLELLGG